MNNKDLNELTYEEFMRLIDKVITCSSYNEVELIGNHKTFEELMAEGFPLADFKYTKSLKLDESQLYIIPIHEHKNIKIIFEE